MESLVQFENEAAVQPYCVTVAKSIIKPLVIHLIGEIGYGKSTFVRTLFRALGVKGAIKSPTYTLFEEYLVGDEKFVHADFYRISAEEELEFIGFDEAVKDASLVCIEWPENVANSLQAADLRLSFSIVNEGARKLHLKGISSRGAQVLEAISLLDKS